MQPLLAANGPTVLSGTLGHCEDKMAKEPTAKYDKGLLTITLPVDGKNVSMSSSGKSAVLGGATIRDVMVDGEAVRVSVSCYIPLKQPKKASETAAKIKMTLADARKVAAKAAEE